MSQVFGSNSSNFIFDNELVALLDISTPQPTIVLSGKPCEILRYLMSSSNKVLSVSEIQQAVWGNTIVTRGSVKDYIAQIRAALQDSASSPEFIETIRGRGYRYMGGILIQDSMPKRSTIKPTLAVVPLLFCDKSNLRFEMAGEIIAATVILRVSKSPLINTVSSLSSRQFKHNCADSKLIRQSLGADYLLSGLYHCQNNRLQLCIELSHVEDSTIVWSDSISGTAAELSDGSSAQLQRLTRKVTDEILWHQINLTTPDQIETLILYTMIINALPNVKQPSNSFSPDRKAAAIRDYLVN